MGQRPGDTGNSFTLPGYGVVDAFVSYETKIGKFPTKFQLSMKNVFDKTYYPSSASNLIVAVGQERVTMLTTSMSF